MSSLSYKCTCVKYKKFILSEYWKIHQISKLKTSPEFHGKLMYYYIIQCGIRNIFVHAVLNRWTYLRHCLQFPLYSDLWISLLQEKSWVAVEWETASPCFPPCCHQWCWSGYRRETVPLQTTTYSEDQCSLDPQWLEKLIKLIMND